MSRTTPIRYAQSPSDMAPRTNTTRSSARDAVPVSGNPVARCCKGWRAPDASCHGAFETCRNESTSVHESRWSVVSAKPAILRHSILYLHACRLLQPQLRHPQALYHESCCSHRTAPGPFALFYLYFVKHRRRPARSNRNARLLPLTVCGGESEVDKQRIRGFD